MILMHRLLRDIFCDSQTHAEEQAAKKIKRLSEVAKKHKYKRRVSKKMGLIPPGRPGPCDAQESEEDDESTDTDEQDDFMGEVGRRTVKDQRPSLSFILQFASPHKQHL